MWLSSAASFFATFSNFTTLLFALFSSAIKLSTLERPKRKENLKK